MQPTIYDGDVVTLIPLAIPTLQPGDIILYTSRRKHAVLHRIIQRNETQNGVSFILRGDASSKGGDEVEADRIVGIVASVERHGHIVPHNIVSKPPNTIQRLQTVNLSQIRHNIKRGILLYHTRLTNRPIYRHLAKKCFATHVYCRLATQEDIDAICKLYGYDSVDAIRSVSAGISQSITIVALLGRQIIGAVDVYPNRDKHWWISGLMVRTLYRGMGIGKRLTMVALQKATDSQADNIGLYAAHGNVPAINLYRQLGFTEVSTIDSSRKEAFDRIKMIYKF